MNAEFVEPPSANALSDLLRGCRYRRRVPLSGGAVVPDSLPYRAEIVVKDSWMATCGLLAILAMGAVSCGDLDPQGLTCCDGVDTTGIDCSNVQDELNEAIPLYPNSPYGGETHPVIQCLGAYGGECQGTPELESCPRVE